MKIFNVIILLATVYTGMAQSAYASKADSLAALIPTVKTDTGKVKLWADISESYYQENPDKGIAYADTAIRLARKINWQRGLAKALSAKAGNCVMINKNEDAILLCTEALQLYLQLKDTTAYAARLGTLGLAYQGMSDYKKALATYLQSASVNERLHKPKALYRTYANLCGLYTQMENNAKAIEYGEKSIAIARSLGEPEYLLGPLNNTGGIYIVQGNYKKALTYLLEAKKLSESSGPSLLLADCIGNIGISWLHLGYFKSGQKEIQNAMAMQQSLGNSDAYNNALIDLGLIYCNYATGILKPVSLEESPGLSSAQLLQQALKYTLQGYDSSKSGTNKEMQYTALNNLGLIYKAQGNYKAALTAFEAYITLRDSLMNDESRQKITRQEIAFEFSKREDSLKIIQLVKDRGLQQEALLQKEARKNTLYASLLGFTVILSGVGFLIYRNKVGQMKKIMSVRNAIAKDLHDDVGSTLSSISITSQLLERKSFAGDIASGELLQSITRNSQAMMDNMSDIVWSIDPYKDKLQDMLTRMRQLAASVLEPQDIDIHFDVSPQAQKVQIPMEMRKELYLIFKEAINNIAKYAGCSKVSIRLATTGRSLQMDIEDNGKGFEPDKIKSTGGNGLKNMQQRALQLHGGLSVDTAPGAGTTISLTVPLTA